MRGVISAIAPDGTYGQIAADDGQRYSYWTNEIRNGRVQVGEAVNFQMADGQPVDIFILPKPGPDAPPPRGAMTRQPGFTMTRAQASATPAYAGAQAGYAAADTGMPPANYWIALFTSPSGRISRRQFWLHGVLPIIGASIAFWAVAHAFILIAPSIFLLVSFAIFLILLWPMLCISYKRFQDVGYPGWYNLFWLVPLAVARVFSVVALLLYGFGFGYLFGTLALVLSPIAGLVVLAALIFVYIRVGQDGPNQYGPDPLAAG